MRKITFLLVLILCMTSNHVYGRQLSATEAQSIALNHLRENNRLNATGATPQLDLALTAKSKSMDVDYYVFNMSEDKGYIIISGDDRASAVLAYSDEGTFDINSIPDGLQYWLDVYSQEMQYLRDNPNAPKAYNRSQLSSSVRPLLTCNWNQGEPYNNLCPTYSDNGTTKRAVTGCVATAAAQIMYYHRWPVTGTGSHSYVCNVNKTGEQTLSADFGSTTYDWDNMLDSYDGSYTDTQANAVATLMYHVGVSCDMNYGSSSGAQTYAMMEALRNYFGYSKGMRDFKRGNTPIDQWEQTIRTELDNSRPVLYAGFTPTGGHAFVFDGYDTDGYFHVNWGWGGASNGYFLVTALNPSDQGIGSFEGGYNSGQEIVTGICRDDNSTEPLDYIELICEDYKSTVSQVNLGEAAPISLNRFSINGHGYYPTVAVYFGFNLTDQNNNTIDFSSNNCYAYNFKFGASYSFSEDYTPPSSLSNGQYRLWLMYKVPDAGMTDYVPYNHSNTTTGYINVTVQNGVMYFSEPETNDGILSLESLEVPAKVGTNSNFEVKATIANAGDEYYDNIYFVVKQQGNIVSTSDPIKIDVPMGDDVIIKSFITAPATAGTYQLAVLDKKNQMIGQPVTLNVAESSNYSLSISSQLTTPSYYMDPYNIQASAVISNSGTGDYIGVIQMMITDEAVSKVKKLVNSPTVIIPAGGSATVNFQCEYGGNEGVVYKMCLRNVNYPNSYYVWGDKIAFEIKSAILAEDISLNESSIALNLGETTMLSATIAPDNATVKAVQWSSSDSGVASVDGNGTVTALALGTATITATTTDGTSLSASCQVTVTAVTGDANGDGTINVSDYVATTSYILERDPQPFVFEAADVDSNDEINVCDLVGVAYLALTYEGAPPLEMPAFNLNGVASLSIDAQVKNYSTKTYNIAINLSNDIDLTALQMDVTLPNGMTLADVALSDRASASHQVTFNNLSNGDYRLVVASPACKAFKGNEGTVLTLTLNGDASSTIVLHDIKLSTPLMQGYSFDDIELTAGVTGIEHIFASGNIWADRGNIIIMAPADGKAQLILPNGASTTVNVVKGKNVYPAPANGLVIVKMNGSAKKIIINK